MNFAFVFAGLYLFVLSGHFLYTRSVLREKKLDLVLGPVQTPGAILIGLLAINGFGLTAFLWPNSNWIAFHASVHVLLALYEVIRAVRQPRRWPFFVNHLCFFWSLWIYRGTVG